MDFRFLLLLSVITISTNAQNPNCCILEVWGNCVIPCPNNINAVKYLYNEPSQYRFIFQGSSLMKQRLMTLVNDRAIKMRSEAVPAIWKKITAAKKMRVPTADQTCATCIEMIDDFKSLLISQQALQYWDEIVDSVRPI